MSGSRFITGDRLLLKKQHPCGGREFIVLRGGSDAHIRCVDCGRELTVSRVKLEKSIRQIISSTDCVKTKNEPHLDEERKEKS